MKIIAHNVINFDTLNKNNRLYSKEIVCKYLDENSWDNISIVYSLDKEAFKFDWEATETIGIGKFIYNEEENSLGFEGIVSDNIDKTSFPYLTIRCMADVKANSPVDEVKNITNLQTYLSIDSAFTDTPNYEVIENE